MTFVQSFCDNFCDNFLSRTHIMFLLSFSIDLVLCQHLFFFVNLWLFQKLSHK